jgi:hypothetical protein
MTVVNVDIHVYQPADEKKLDEVLRLLHQIIGKEGQIMASLDDVITDIEQQDTVIDGVTALINQLREDIKAAAGDQAKIDKIFASVEGQKAKLAAALVANTDPTTTTTTTTQP